MVLSAAQYTITGRVTDSDREEIENILSEAEHSFLSKFKMDSNFQLTIHVCSDLQEFLRLTGASRWNGGHFVRDTIYLQRLVVLRERGILEQTVIHEFLHYCVRSVAGAECPVWLNEGLVLNLSGEAKEMGCFEKEIGEEVSYDELDKKLRAKEAEVVKGAYCLAAKLVERLLRAVTFEGILRVLGKLKEGDGEELKEVLGKNL